MPVPLLAVNVPVTVPATVGVPVIAPVLTDNDKPVGKVPALIDHVIGVLPVALLT